MGYNVYVTRAERWTDSAARPITLPEWLAHVARDPELELDEESAVWTGGQEAWFHDHDGRISAVNPDADTVAKLVVIARAFGANVIGDDGERYG